MKKNCVLVLSLVFFAMSCTSMAGVLINYDSANVGNGQLINGGTVNSVVYPQGALLNETLPGAIFFNTSGRALAQYGVDGYNGGDVGTVANITDITNNAAVQIDGFTVYRGAYTGGNNSFGFLENGTRLGASGNEAYNGDAFANAGEFFLFSDVFNQAIAPIDTVTVSFQGGSDDGTANFSVYLLLDGATSAIQLGASQDGNVAGNPRLTFSGNGYSAVSTVQLVVQAETAGTDKRSLIDNVFMEVVSGSGSVIIGGSVGNGDFEDFSGAWIDATAVAGEAGINGTAPDYTRVWMKNTANIGKTYGIDGWTAELRHSEYTSFDRRTDGVAVGASSAAENRSYNLNQWARAILTSDTYNKNLTSGDTLLFNFHHAGNLMRLNAAAVFDEGTASEWTHYFIGSATTTEDFTSTGHTDFKNAGVFSYTLGVGESASTVKVILGGYDAVDGADYGMIKRNNGTGIIDNVYLGLVPGTTSSGVDVRAYGAAEGVVVEFTAYDVEADGTIMLALMDDDGEVAWSGSVAAEAGDVFHARFVVPGLEVGESYDFQVRDEVGKWWTADGVTVQPFAAEMSATTLTGIEITFDSLPQRTYEIQWSEELGADWVTVDTVTSTSTRTVRTVVHPDPEGASGFFRVKLK